MKLIQMIQKMMERQMSLHTRISSKIIMMMIQMILEQMKEENTVENEGQTIRMMINSRICTLLPDATEKRPGKRKSLRNGSSPKILVLINFM